MHHFNFLLQLVNPRYSVTLLVLFLCVSVRAQDVTVTGQQKEFYAGSATALDGAVYNAGASTLTLPNFSVIIHDTSGDGSITGVFRQTKSGGRFKANETQVNSSGGQVFSDGHTATIAASNVLF